MELMITKLLAPILVLTRLSAFFLVAPVFSWQSIPARIKIGFIFLMTIFISTAIPIKIDSSQVSAIQAILLISSETIYGFALGLIVALIFSVIKFCGEIIEHQMGMAMAEMLDPLTGSSSQPLSGLLEMIFVLLFLAANGHHMLLLIITKSYEAFAVGSIPTFSLLLEGTVEAASTMFIAGLRLAAPMLTAFLLLLVTLAVFARITPDMDILFISMPLNIGLGLLMIGLFIPYIAEFINEFADLMGKLLPL